MAGADGAARREIRPQAGPQTAFLASGADITIYGGAAGGGKTWGLLLEPLRHLAVKDFAAVVFRRTTVQIRNPGALWDESVKLYRPAGLTPTEHELTWRRRGGAKIKFAHLEHDKTAFDWEGAQIPLICFDELTHFSAAQFWRLLARNRSMCGVAPYIRATCNPDCDSWVAELVAWWIDPESGYPIEARAGVLRWFVRTGDDLVWADEPESLRARFPDIPPKSLTFIPARLNDNVALAKANPEYLANLMALPHVERERLLRGNWKIRAAAGLLFQRRWCPVIDAAPAGLKMVRGWDLAGTPASAGADPDWTCGTKIGRAGDGGYVVLDHVRLRGTPAEVERLIRNTASQDGAAVEISIPQDPGQAGKWQGANLVKLLAGYTVRTSPETGDKVQRFGPFSAQAEVGNVAVLRGDWNATWFRELENFPPPAGAGHDDDADATSRAFNAFLNAARPSRVAYSAHMER